MPPWFDEILKQCPILAVTLVVVWVAYRQMAKQHDEHMQLTARQREAHVKALARAYERHLSSKDEEIERLEADKNGFAKRERWPLQEAP